MFGPSIRSVTHNHIKHLSESLSLSSSSSDQTITVLQINLFSGFSYSLHSFNSCFCFHTLITPSIITHNFSSLAFPVAVLNFSLAVFSPLTLSSSFRNGCGSKRLWCGGGNLGDWNGWVPFLFIYFALVLLLWCCGYAPMVGKSTKN